MKYLKCFAAVTLLFAVSTVSYQVGRNSNVDAASKDYQAACMLGDICHFALDNCEDFEDLYWDYVDNIECDSKATITKEEIQKYYWCY